MKKRHRHNLSHYRLQTMNMGLLTPVGCLEILPGDTTHMRTSALVRFDPMVSPVMHPVHMHLHHFFVPTRLLWDDFEDFITGGEDGENESEVPYFMGTVNSLGAGSLANYLGVPVPNSDANADALKYSALPARAYNLIYNEWYRDKDLQLAVPISKESGEDEDTAQLVQRVAWSKDYFTTARPWPQKGPDVTLPLGNLNLALEGTADMTQYGFTSNGMSNGSYGYTPSYVGAVANGGKYSFNRAANDNSIYGTLTPTVPVSVTGESPVGAISITALREAAALQRFQEARARYGSEYKDYLNYLGIRSSDARLQRPEFLGGGKQTIQFSEVLQTGTNGDDPIGSLYGHGITAMRSNRFSYFAEEHGYIISLAFIRPISVYMNNIDRTYLRETKEDYFQSELAHIGQQEITNNEIYFGSDTPEDVFGYQNRYDEYRHQRSRVAGMFATSEDYWHLGREFTEQPSLNSEFIACNPSQRIFAANNTAGVDTVKVMANHSIICRRMVPQRAQSILK